MPVEMNDAPESLLQTAKPVEDFATMTAASGSPFQTLRLRLLSGAVASALVGCGVFAYFYYQARSQQLRSEVKVGLTERWAEVSNKLAVASLALPDLVADGQVQLSGTTANDGSYLAIASDKGDLLAYSLEPPKITKENLGNLPKISLVPGLGDRLENLKTAVASQAGETEAAGNLWVYRRLSEKSEWMLVAAVPLARLWQETLVLTTATLVVMLVLLVLIGWQLTKKLQATLGRIRTESNRFTGIETQGDRATDEIEAVETAFLGLLSQLDREKERISEEVALSVQQAERLSQARVAEFEEGILQDEVSTLLDVVSALEDGDLTVQAEVSDRATGLVADTLNRLTEQLANIIARVLNTAQEVAVGAKDLEQMAKVVAQNTVQQALSVAKGQELTEQVAISAQSSTAQVRTSTQSLLEVQERVNEGQEAILRLSRGVETLQKGTAQIVQRMKTLGEFVGLAEQFVQDQGQIASLTQVLAINATLVAARAAEQRDPRQFVGVAREFEAIAGQVNTLATQTNDGLSVLQQRTSQIQSVVSSIDTEIQQLDNLVDSLTAGVKRSQQAFASVQTETEQVVGVGQKVTQSSIEIAKAAASTAEYMSEIAKIAEKTADLTRSTKSQSEHMGIMAQRLLEGISFFRLPKSAIAAALAAVKIEPGSSQEFPEDFANDFSSNFPSPDDFTTVDTFSETAIDLSLTSEH